MLFIFLYFVLSFSFWEEEKEPEENFPPMSITPTIPFGYYEYSTYFYSPSFETTSIFAKTQVFSQNINNDAKESNSKQVEDQEYFFHTVPPQITPTIPPMKDDEL